MSPKKSLLEKIADRSVLCPSQHDIPSPPKNRFVVSDGCQHAEVWQESTSDDIPAELFVLKFPGTGGRAERATLHPLDAWEGVHAEVWAINPPGYGTCPGNAGLRHMVSTAELAIGAIQEVADGRPILVTGNSLGTAPALYVAARHKVAPLLLRNPPPLRQLIVGRHGWWNFGLGARLVAKMIPDEMESVVNATKCQTPAVFITSAKDRTVPPIYQQQIIESYAGTKRVLTLENAGHATQLDERHQEEYVAHLTWLREQMFQQVESREELDAP